MFGESIGKIRDSEGFWWSLRSDCYEYIPRFISIFTPFLTDGKI